MIRLPLLRSCRRPRRRRPPRSAQPAAPGAVLALGAALLVPACTTAPTPVPTPVPPPHPAPAAEVEIPADRYANAFAAAVETLRRAGFRIDRSDHRFGVVTTRPEGSPTLFEPWKTGNTTAHTRLLSTLNDLRRTVTVTFAAPAAAGSPRVPPPHATPRRMSVAVHVETRDTPGRRLDGRADGRVFNDPAPTAEPEPGAAPTTRWKALGRDPGLERQLQRRILERLDAASTPTSTSTSTPG